MDKSKVSRFYGPPCIYQIGLDVAKRFFVLWFLENLFC